MNLPSAQNTAKRIEAEGGEITVIQTDVTRDAEAKDLVDAVMKKYGRIDVLVKYVSCLLTGLLLLITPTIKEGLTTPTTPRLTRRPQQQRRDVSTRRPCLHVRINLGRTDGRKPQIRLPNVPPRPAHHGVPESRRNNQSRLHRCPPLHWQSANRLLHD